VQLCFQEAKMNGPFIPQSFLYIPYGIPSGTTDVSACVSNTKRRSL
jgi:hypothetical protein